MTDHKKIAELNDLCRKSMGVTCSLVQTFGIKALPENDQSAIREKVELFNDFTEANDPCGEHDFGAIVHNGEKIYWKIDYYDPELKYGSEDPADPKRTARLLTIMLANEY
ncbi:MAG: DUF3768 domain-containing protein [Deltaproteobacteria bacterium]|nr:DUF3768 domain-containing protein [Deltaproteobacteria bacterium]